MHEKKKNIAKIHNFCLLKNFVVKSNCWRCSDSSLNHLSLQWNPPAFIAEGLGAEDLIYAISVAGNHTEPILKHFRTAPFLISLWYKMILK